MRKWGKQGFLNPATSNDDGWYKFSIRPKIRDNRLELNIQYIISDCSNKVYLEFEPNWVRLESDGTVVDYSEAKETLKETAERIKKIRKFSAAVAESAERIEQALLEFQEQVEKAIDRSKRE